MKPSLLAAALLFSLPSAWGANLYSVYRIASEQDAQVLAAREAYKAGIEKLPQAESTQLPTVQVSGNLRRADTQYKSPPSLFSSGDVRYQYSPYGLTIAVQQSLYNEQTLEQVELGRLQAMLAGQQLRIAELDLILRVARAYFEALQAQDTLDTALAQKQAIGEQLALAKKSFEVGAATITDTHEAQARYDLTEAQEIASRNDLEVKRRALEKILNREAPTLDRFGEGQPLPQPQPADMAAWVSLAETGNLGVMQAQIALEAARRTVLQQKAGNKPVVNLAASYSDNRDQAGGSSAGVENRTAVLGLEMSWTPYQGGIVDSRVREAVANQEKARYDLDNARRQAVLDARQGYLGVLSGDARVRALEQAVVSGEAQLKSTSLGVDVGVRTRVDVLNAQQQLFATRRDLAIARYQTLLAHLQLKAAVGLLGEADLMALDKLLRETPADAKK